MVTAAENLGQCACFYGIAHVGTLCRSFDIADASRIDTAVLQCLADNSRFRPGVRHFIAICLTIVIDRTATNKGINAITIFKRLIVRFEDDDPDPFSRNKSIAVFFKGGTR